MIHLNIEIENEKSGYIDFTSLSKKRKIHLFSQGKHIHRWKFITLNESNSVDLTLANESWIGFDVRQHVPIKIACEKWHRKTSQSQNGM